MCKLFCHEFFTFNDYIPGEYYKLKFKAMPDK